MSKTFLILEFLIGNRSLTVICQANGNTALSELKSEKSISVQIHALTYVSASEEIEKSLLYGFLSIVHNDKLKLTAAGLVLFNCLTFLHLNFEDNDEVLKLSVIQKMDTARSQISQDVRSIMMIDPIYIEKTMRLEEHINSEIASKRIEYVAASNTYKRKTIDKTIYNKIMKKNDFLLELNYTEITYTGESPNWVVKNNLERCISDDEATTGLVKDLITGKDVRVKIATIMPIYCQLCSNLMKFRKVEKMSSELKGFIFFTCERLISNTPYKICGYNEYLLSTYEGM